MNRVRPLAGRRIALLENRESERLAGMLEQLGAETVGCPLVAIADAPDPAPVEAWLRRAIDLPFDDLVLFTGEGLRRLRGFADRAGIEATFVDALRRMRTITRGPKPAQALRELGLAPTLRAAEPTTDGLIATLAALDLRGRTVGVQRYPENANPRLIAFLEAAGARPDPILPYVYTTRIDGERIAALIDAMAAGRIDAIAFTSAAQIPRLFEAAQAAGRATLLPAALAATPIAAIGPIVAAELARHGLRAAIVPRDTYFMKPLVSAIADALGG